MVMKNCTTCGKPIQDAAIICKYCKSNQEMLTDNYGYRSQVTGSNIPPVKTGNGNKLFFNKYSQDDLVVILSIAIGLVVVSVIVFFGYPKFTEWRYWSGITETNTLLAYEEYMEKYPEGNYFADAKEKSSELAWVTTIEQNDEYTYLSYITKYPKSKHINKAKERADLLAWENAQKSNDIYKLQNYINNYPKGAYINLAEQLIKSIQYSGNYEDNTYIVYDAYKDPSDPYLNVRTLPTVNSELMAKLEDGTLVTVLETGFGEKGRWNKIIVPETGATGYCSVRWLKKHRQY